MLDLGPHLGITRGRGRRRRRRHKEHMFGPLAQLLCIAALAAAHPTQHEGHRPSAILLHPVHPARNRSLHTKANRSYKTGKRGIARKAGYSKGSVHADLWPAVQRTVRASARMLSSSPIEAESS